MIEPERKFTDDKCKQLIEFKRSVPRGRARVVINQKGIDPLSLDMLKEGMTRRGARSGATWSGSRSRAATCPS